ncbi:MAG: nickel-responsive transcriptional regulator NikR [Halobacteria archaeon]|nr:nickel-responsive transcriptional regulator NikR [Halobacteria archaeon]
MPVVSISVPDKLLDRIDSFVDEHGYSGRSEFIRNASRELIGEFEDASLEGRHLIGTITVVFDFDNSEVENKMIELRHDFEDVVKSNVHSHVGESYCMEVFVLEGDLDEIKRFVGQVRSTSDVLDVNYTVHPIDELL